MTRPDLSSALPAATLGGLSPPALPADWSARLQSAGMALAENERLLAWLAIDLDASLRFAPGMIIVTSERLLAMSADDTQWQAWNYRPGLTLVRRDHAGVGTLELCDASSLLGHWRYTLGSDVAAGRLVDHFSRQLSFRLTGEVPALSLTHI